MLLHSGIEAVASKAVGEFVISLSCEQKRAMNRDFIIEAELVAITWSECWIFKRFGAGSRSIFRDS